MDNIGKLCRMFVGTGVTVSLLVAVVGYVCSSHVVTIYGVTDHAINSGVRIGTDTHNVGYEWRDDTYPTDIGWFVNGN